MLDEIILHIDDRRYVGHVYADPGPPVHSSGLSLHWRFSSRGQFVGEFPALPTDTPEVVRCRLCGMLERIEARGRIAHLPGVSYEIRLPTADKHSKIASEM